MLAVDVDDGGGRGLDGPCHRGDGKEVYGPGPSDTGGVWVSAGEVLAWRASADKDQCVVVEVADELVDSVT